MVVLGTNGPQRGRRLDDETLTQLYDEHAGPLLAYTLRLTSGDRQRAEDIVQETLLRAWRHPEALVGGHASPRGWLRTVARNLVLDDHRARQVRPPEVTEPPVEMAAHAQDDGIDRALEAWVVAEALQALTPAHRAVLVETFYRGRSVTEASATLGVPPGTVKSRTFYALRALRGALAERGVLS